MGKIRYENTRPEVAADEARTLPARYYTDPALFREEMRAIHFRMWLHVGRTEQLPQPGSFIVIKIAGANVVIVRNEQGEIAAFHNVCRHRGTLLCKEHSGQLEGRIRCPYHAWTYDLDGHLISAPHMEKVVGFDRNEYPLNPVACEIWDGHIFINLAEQPMPSAEYLAGLDRKFAPWGMADLKLVERRTYHLQANWKLILQNYSECLHCPIAHPLLNKHSHYMSGDNEPPQPTYLGGRMDLRDGVETLSIDGSSPCAPLPGLNEEQRRQVYYYALLPNLLLNLHPDYMLTFQLWPVAPDRTDIICEWHFHPDAIAQPGFDPSGPIEFWELTNQQDWELSDRAQEGISSLGYRPGPYSNREELLHALDVWVLEKLAELRPAGVMEPSA
ncbi:MAG TPA: aromatic ring-hydroxylating dioxygenase subunit alpha [Lysobacter sp.]|jgi:Rieske 2Fe-2S family protein|nr:aromatic ring-hydroxylating dioxygenase subunit alpha [Lysobacter sp.]